LTSRDYYFTLSAGAAAESVAIVEAESVAIVVVSVDIVAVESVVVVSSVFGLLWQAANVSMLPTNSRANTFFIPFSDFLGFRMQI
jgi:hypothetical protein